MKIAVSFSGRAADLSTGKEIGPQMYGVAMLMDNGRIYASPYLSAPMEPAAPEPANVVDIAIGKAGLFSLDKGGRIYKWAARDGKPRAWRRDEVAKDVVGLTCDSGGNLWCVNKKGEMFMAEAEFAGLGAADTQYEPGPWTPDESSPSTAAFWGGSTWSLHRQVRGWSLRNHSQPVQSHRPAFAQAYLRRDCAAEQAGQREPDQQRAGVGDATKRLCLSQTAQTRWPLDGTAVGAGQSSRPAESARDPGDPVALPDERVAGRHPHRLPLPLTDEVLVDGRREQVGQPARASHHCAAWT